MMKTIMMVVAMAIVLCGSSGNGPVSIVSAAPIGPPDLTNCNPRGHECCLRSSTPSTFIRLNSSTPLRTRRALQNVLQNRTYLTNLNAAYARLRSIERENSTDPRGLGQQRSLHCAFCSQLVYGDEYNMHFNWFFLPWHRMLLFYHERILAWAVGDPNFALPFWNWDSNDTAHTDLPAPYANTTSALYTANRKPTGDIGRQIRRDFDTRTLFGSVGNATLSDAVMGTATAGTPGTLESSGHGAVHMAVGLPDSPWREMGALAWAGYDPVFYAHHANVDRMWSVWRQLPRRSDPRSADFRNSRFVFYDENAIARVIAVSDVLDHRTNLRYVYENVDNAWTRDPGAVRTSRTVPVDDVSRLLPPLGRPSTFQASVTVSPRDGNVATAVVQSPQSTARALPELILQNVAHSGGEPLALYVFINQPDANVNTPRVGNPNYVGARFLVAGGMSMPVSFTLPLSVFLQDLNIPLSSNFTVQVVRGTQFGAPKRPLSIQSINYVHARPV